jgi:hypothetical protein
VLLGVPISNDLPYNDFFEYYAPDFKLHLTPSTMEDQNKREHLDNITNRILQNLKNLQGAPSVQMYPIPPDWMISNQTNPQEFQDNNPDKKSVAMTSDGATKRENGVEFYADDADGDTERFGTTSRRGNKGEQSRSYLFASSSGGSSESQGEGGSREKRKLAKHDSDIDPRVDTTSNVPDLSIEASTGATPGTTYTGEMEIETVD